MNEQWDELRNKWTKEWMKEEIYKWKNEWMKWRIKEMNEGKK